MASMKLGSKSEVFHRKGQAWFCMTGLPSDVVIEVGEMSFHLHKFPLLSRSGILEKMIADSSGENGTVCTLQLHDVPGGAKAFELVAKFCYGVKLELTALNVVCLRCAAEHLRMTEDYGEGNLEAQTESFLNEVFGSWKDSVKVLETCEDILPQAEKLHIVSRCIYSLANKACADPTLFGWPISVDTSMQSPGGSILWNGIGSGGKLKTSMSADWWHGDVSFLSLPLYKRLILEMESRGMKPESIAGSLIFYVKQYLPGLARHSSFCENMNRASGAVSAPLEGDQRTLLEEIVGLLPMKKGVASTKFLLGLLRTAMILHANPSCSETLEKRIGWQLDQAALEDLLIPNLGYSVETLYDIDCIQRILDHFMLVDQSVEVVSSCGIVDEGQLIESPSLTPMTMVAKLVDGYLAEVAPDVNLKLPKFQSLAAVIPDYARQQDDGIYRAIDIYLKAHPWLTESEKEQVCRLMNCQKLSLEASTHAAQNERLPIRVIVQVLFFEQLRLRTSIAGWFFVSDNLEKSQAPNGTLALPHKNDGPAQSEGNKAIAIDDVRMRVSELEEEYLSLKREIEKLGRTKSSWNIFSKLLGVKSKSQSCSAKEVPTDDGQNHKTLAD